VQRARSRNARGTNSSYTPSSHTRTWAFQITPDGHCLFSAIADQLSLLSLLPSSEASYTTTRSTAAKFILEHRDDFLPFLPSVSGEDGAGATDDGIMTPAQFEQYCRNMAETGEWGGEPEILALSRAFSVPIHVVQSGTPRIVIHEPTDGPPKTTKPVMISYHRRMYGLGEASLRRDLSDGALTCHSALQLTSA
jgi:OTU domain-containing protein 6